MAYSMRYTMQPKQTANLKQNQVLMMLPKMQQAIGLLQAPIMEIRELIDQEIERNPLLEYVEEEGEVEEKESEDPEPVDFDHQTLEILSKLGEEYRDFFAESGDGRSIDGRSKRDQEKLQSYQETLIVGHDSLFEYLMKQAKETFSTEEEIRGAEVLIGSLDERGFLENSLEEMALLANVSVEKMGVILKEIQQFDPVGVGAHDIREALLFQLKGLGKEESIAYQLIENFYDDLLHNRLPLIEKQSGYTMMQIEEALQKDIALLDIRPGMRDADKEPVWIIPDASIRQEGESLIVDVHDDELPPLRLNANYLKMLRSHSLEDSTKHFIEEHVSSAKWLMKNLLQRSHTLHRILTYLAEEQRSFLMNVEGELKPMVMLQVASALSLHESTIARAVSGKYIDTPRGLLPLRSFFSNRFTKESGEEMSSQTVRQSLKKLIEEENKMEPHSDEALSSLLKEQGIPCARRTVAKYRQELSIGNTRQRKKFRFK